MLNSSPIILQFLVLAYMNQLGAAKEKYYLYLLATTLSLFIQAPTKYKKSQIMLSLGCILGIANTILFSIPIVSIITTNPIHHHHDMNASFKILIGIQIIIQMSKQAFLNRLVMQKLDNFRTLANRNAFIRVYYYAPLLHSALEFINNFFITSLYLELNIHVIDIHDEIKLSNLAVSYLSFIGFSLYQLFSMIEAAIFCQQSFVSEKQKQN